MKARREAHIAFINRPILGDSILYPDGARRYTRRRGQRFLARRLNGIIAGLSVTARGGLLEPDAWRRPLHYQLTSRPS